MSSAKHVWFACKKCHSFYPTLERGIQHLINSPQHTADTIDLINRYGDSYRDAAARMLSSFTFHTEPERDASIEQAKLAALDQATGARRNRHIISTDDDDDDDDQASGPCKRGRHDAAPGDHSNRSQNVTNQSSVTNNVFMEPITVRVTVCPRPTHAEAVFTFPFARDKHTTIGALLQGVEASYRQRADAAAAVDLAALGAERLMMKLSKKNGARIGGSVEGDGDVRDLSGVTGGGWFGEMEIG